MDILLDKSGDLQISSQGDIAIGKSVAQKIRIKLSWFENEWRWNKEEGMAYMDTVFVKNPDKDAIENMVRAAIFEVEEIVEVTYVEVSINHKERKAVIRFSARTDLETITEEVNI